MCQNNPKRYRNKKKTWIFQRKIKKIQYVIFSRGKLNSLASKQSNKLFIVTYAHFSARSRLGPATAQVLKWWSKNTPYLATRQPRLEREKRGEEDTGASGIRSAVRTLFCPFRPFPPPCRQSSAFCTRCKQTPPSIHRTEAVAKRTLAEQAEATKRKGASTWPLNSPLANKLDLIYQKAILGCMIRNW
jgi:hypothetical protein